jgi:hypothetical protein
MAEPNETETFLSPAAAADPPSAVTLHLPVSIRSASLVVLTVLTVLAALRWASAFFIPLMLGFMFSYALSPLVDWFEQRVKVPRVISAAVLILGLLGAVGGSVYSFSDDINQLVTSLPEAAQKVRDSLRRQSRASTAAKPLETVQKAAAKLEEAAAEASPATAADRGVQRVVIEKPKFDIREHLWTGTLGLASLVGQVVVVTFLTFFLLVSGDTFRRKLVKISGDTLSQKKITVQALDEINLQIQRYLMVQLVTSGIVGVATGLSFWALGVRQRSAQPDSLHRFGGGHRRRGAGGLPAVRRDQHGAGRSRRLAAHSHPGRQSAGALADQPHQPDESGGGVRWRAGLELAWGEWVELERLAPRSVLLVRGCGPAAAAPAVSSPAVRLPA